MSAPLRLVLDTNIWLDWLVFGDPGAELLDQLVSPLLPRRGGSLHEGAGAPSSPASSETGWSGEALTTPPAFGGHPSSTRRGEETARAQIFVDAPCLAELARVLAYDLGKHSIDSDAQQRALAECARRATRIDSAADAAALAKLPKCRDPDDQKFLALALAARADCLVTKDRELLALARRSPFAIQTLDQLGQRLAATA